MYKHSNSLAWNTSGIITYATTWYTRFIAIVLSILRVFSCLLFSKPSTRRISRRYTCARVFSGFLFRFRCQYPLSNTTRKEIRIRHTERGYVCVSYLIRPRRVRLEMNARGQKSKSCNRVGRSVLISRVRVVFKAAAAGYSSDRRRFDIVN